MPYMECLGMRQEVEQYDMYFSLAFFFAHGRLAMRSLIPQSDSRQTVDPIIPWVCGLHH